MAIEVAENGAGGVVSNVEPPHSIAQARVDDKGRLKLPAEFLEYLKKLGVDKVFITTVDRELARIYPISVWKANEFLFANAGDLAEVAGEAALLVDPEDIEELGAGLRLLSTDDHVREGFVRMGLARAAEFPWDFSRTSPTNRRF